jgi:flagellar motor switch protein FliG
MSPIERSRPSGARKAAILLSFLGEDVAAPILRSLPESDLGKITREIATLARVPVNETMQVIEEYQQMMASQEFVAVGGQDVANRLMVKAFGEQGAKNMVDRINGGEEGPTFDIETLKQTDPQQLARFLLNEHPQTKALILGHLDAKQASALLMKLEPEVRADCVKRLATMGQFSPQVAAKISNVLHRRLKSVGDQAKLADSGAKSLAEMMNRLEPTASREILESIEKNEPNLATSIRDLMFTFEDLLGVPEQDLRELVNSIDKKTLMVALKGATEDLRNHIYRTMSSRAVEMLKEDSEVMGPVRGKDVAKAQMEMVAIARKLEAEGKIVLKSEGDDDYVV